MLKLIHLSRAMRYAAWMERANDPHVLRSPAPVAKAPAAKQEPARPVPMQPKKSRAQKLPHAK